MEISTIIGIIIAILIILYALKMIFQKPINAEPSLDTALHIDADSQKPIIPRHVRDQLQTDARVEPTLSSAEVELEDARVDGAEAEKTAAAKTTADATVANKTLDTSEAAIDLPQVTVESEKAAVVQPVADITVEAVKKN